jgi:hypothetical protein
MMMMVTMMVMKMVMFECKNRLDDDDGRQILKKGKKNESITMSMNIQKHCQLLWLVLVLERLIGLSPMKAAITKRLG